MSKYGYQVQGNAEEGVVSVLLRLSDIKDKDGKVIYEDNEAGLFFAGNVIPEDEIATHIIEKYEAGDEHTLATFTKVTLSDISDEEVAEEAAEEVAETPAPKSKPAAKKTPAKSTSAE